MASNSPASRRARLKFSHMLTPDNATQFVWVDDEQHHYSIGFKHSTPPIQVLDCTILDILNMTNSARKMRRFCDRYCMIRYGVLFTILIVAVAVLSTTVVVDVLNRYNATAYLTLRMLYHLIFNIDAMPTYGPIEPYFNVLLLFVLIYVVLRGFIFAADWLTLQYFIGYIKTRVVFVDLYTEYISEFDSFGNMLPSPPFDHLRRIIPEDTLSRIPGTCC
jgi:hypothetical protein